LRVEFAAELDVAKRADLAREVAEVLKHVAQIVRARETESAVHLRFYRVVADGTIQGAAVRCRHLLTRNMFAGNTDRLADVFLGMVKNRVGTTTDILSSDSGNPGISHR